MMGSVEATTTIPKLSLFSMSPISAVKKSPAEPSGMLTPPIHTSAAVPFGWEEEPGKPRPCTTLTTTTKTTALELPPRLFSLTTVLEGPYMKKRPKASSFRMTIKESCNYKYNNTLSGLEDEQQIQLGGAIFLSKRWQRQRLISKDKSWFFGGWSKRRKLEEMLKRSSDPGELSFVFPSDSLYRDCDIEDDEYGDDVSNITRTGSFAIHSHSQSQHKSQFWATIYGGLKQVMPWKSKKLKKNGIVN